VVNVSVQRKAAEPRKPPDTGDNPELAEFFRRFAPATPTAGARLSGAGTLISADGYVLTGEHLFQSDDTVTVRLHDGRTLAASIVGKDQRSGVGLLKIPAGNLQFAALGDPRKLRLAERVFGMGAQPGGKSAAVTDGIVSSLEVDDPTANGFIQTTVTLYPAMGGGPLFNLAGQMVGVNTMLYSRATGGSGLSFAIPIDDAMAVVQELRAHGRVRRGTLGVNLQDVTALTAATYGMDAPAGVMVVTVNPGSPAAEAGIQQGDLILRLGGEPVNTVNQAVRYISRTHPGDKLVVRLRRMKDVREENVTATLAEAGK
jgi:serine protease Do